MTVFALALLVILLVADAAYGAALLLTREPGARPLTGDRIFHASRPAVVLVQGQYSVKASIPEADLAPGKRDDITNQLVAMVREGKIGLDENQLDQAAFDIIASNPDAYLVPSSKRIDDSFELANSGTGFYVTEDGYLVTASHVVSASNADLKAELLELQKQPASVASLRDGLKKSIESDAGFSVSDAQLDRLSSWEQGWEAKYVTLDNIQARYFVSSGRSVEAGDRLASTGARASLVRGEPAYPDRDVALLKADVTGVPALRLANTTPRPGQADYVIGYPRKDYLTDAASFNASVPIVLSGGRVQSKIDRSDWTAYGTNAQVTHGNSGGPVLDSHGDVAGVISFGVDASGSTPAQNYFVPSGVVKQLLAKAGVVARPGTATAAYYRALQEGDARHYRHELPELQALAQRMPADAYVKEDIVAAQSSVLSGDDRTPPNLLPYWPVVLAGSGGGLLVVLVLLAIGLRARRRVVPAVAEEPGMPDVQPPPESPPLATPERE